MPPGGFSSRGNVFAGTTPEQRNQMAAAGAAAIAVPVAAPYVMAVARTPLGQEAIKAGLKGAAQMAGAGTVYQIGKKLWGIFGK